MPQERRSLCAERHTGVAMNLRSELGNWKEVRQQARDLESLVRPQGWQSDAVLCSLTSGLSLFDACDLFLDLTYGFGSQGWC